jgi:hypothetical protein
MPIEVRELIIKATVQQETGGAGKPGGSGSNNGVGPNEEMIQTCLDKLSDILNGRNER